MGCGASRGVDVRPLSPVVPGSDAPNLTTTNGVVSPPPQPQPESEPATVPTAPDTTADTPTTFTNMQSLPSPASTATPTEEGAPDARWIAEVGGSSVDRLAQQLEAPTPRVRPKRPPGPAPPQAKKELTPAPATPVTVPPEAGKVGPPGAAPGRQRKIPRPPPLQVGLTLELMEESEEEDSPIVARKSVVQVGISGATPRSIREIDQSGDYRGIGTPKRTASPFLRGDAFDESEESDAMSSCSEDSTGIFIPSRTLKEQGQTISGSLRPTTPDWCWRLDMDPDRLRRALAMNTPTHSLASSSPLVEISLPRCSLGPGALSVIASVLLEGSAGNLRQTLQKLCLADNQLVGADPAAYKPTPDADLSGLNALTDALRGQTKGEDRQTAALEILDLRRNVIGPKGITILASAVWTTGTARPLQLQRLQLSDNLITGSVLCPPAPMATNMAIAVADDGEEDGPIAPPHSDPRVGSSTGWAWQLDASAGGFSRLLAHNQSLAPPSFLLGLREGVHLHRLRQQFVSLELRKCYLGPDAADILLKALMSSTTGTVAAQLHRLDLYHNRIGDQAAVALCHFAVTGSTHAAPHSSDGGIRELLLGFNGLTHSCCKPIGAALAMSAVDRAATNTDSGNDTWQGEEHGCTGISDCDNAGSADNNDSRMSGNQWGLRVLDLTWNSLEPRGMKALCKSIGTLRAAAATDAVTLKRVRLTDGTEDSLDLHTLQQLLDGTGSTSGQESDTVGAAVDLWFVATKKTRKIHGSNATAASYDFDGDGEEDEDADQEIEAASMVAGFEIVLKRRT